LAKSLGSAGLSPNVISTAGMVASLAGGAAVAATSFVSPAWPLFVCAAAMMQVRLLANMFDGMVAIETGRTSPVGELFNEVPDRVSDTAFFVGMGYALGGNPALGYWAAILAVMTAYVRAAGGVAGAAQDYCGPMAKPQRMAIGTVGCLLATVIPVEWLPHSERLPGAGIMTLVLAIIVGGCLVTIIRRLIRIATSLRNRPS
jgi:phosphatidylglycerophosphate synthase